MGKKDDDLKPFVVRVLEIPCHKRFEVGPELVGEWLRGMPMRDALGAPEIDPEAGGGVAELDLYNDPSHVFAHGKFDGFLHVACSRCVAPAKIEIHETLRVTFMPQSEMPADTNAEDTSEEGVEVPADDLDVFAFDGERVDFEPLLREQFVLSVPYAPLCRENCAGLCPQCGIDRNSATCTCEKPIDPRLAALKGLKLPS